MIHNWMRMLLAILLGNVIYLTVQLWLPENAQHQLYRFDPGLLVDFAICSVIYLVLRKGSA